MHSLRNILVATDFSTGADAALDAAIVLAAAGSARITLLHVCELTGAAAALDEDAMARGTSRLHAALAERGGAAVELVSLLRIGRPADKINNAAAEVGASLIVLGRSGADRATALGSITDRVLRTASRPVLVVCAKETV